MIVANFPFNGDVFEDDTSENNCFTSYKCAEPNMLFDVAEEYMVLPFLEDTIKNSNANDPKSCEKAVIDPNNSGLYPAMDQMRSCNDSVVNSSDSDQAECFDPQLFIRNLPELSDVVSNFQTNVLPDETPKRKPITLVLDLDGK